MKKEANQMATASDAIALQVRQELLAFYPEEDLLKT